MQANQYVDPIERARRRDERRKQAIKQAEAYRDRLQDARDERMKFLRSKPTQERVEPLLSLLLRLPPLQL